MKALYIERIENHLALDWHKFCAKCGAHEYDVVEQVYPETFWKWYVKCPQCGHETAPSSSKKIAIDNWKEA